MSIIFLTVTKSLGKKASFELASSLHASLSYLKNNVLQMLHRINSVADIPYKNNFDLLRLVLAFSVCLAHLGEISGVSAFIPLSHYFYSGVAVDCFFVVSGFLIFRSHERSSSLFSYLNKRLRRIYPAYVTVVLLAAIVMPLLATAETSLFFSPEWFRYLFANLFFLNFLQPDLPGVFTANPLQVINAPLWTIKVEVMFYLSLPLIFLLFRNRKKWLVLGLLYAASIAYSSLLLHLHHTSGLESYLRLEKQLPGQLAFFLGGGGIYLYFSFFKRHWWKFFLISLLFLILKGYSFFPALYPLALAIGVISFAVCLPYAGNWGKYGDISYGVYIFHFPLIQLFTYFGIFQPHPWLAFTLLILSILLTAACSYHLIERPFLQKSSHYRQAAEQDPSCP
ncbi:MAG: acyltransferase [Proteobacteria bacterium]|nr:acyltransferase [Pseudomonadota bacterium]MBU1138759.1 acyltransferase [Pseudomonadota bacterium]MBU1418609.1 acyltransferase [Pseudomonadota bacterium]MBU1454181.1 acyltransferase [Pseudomonadota bacterium]